MLPNSSVNQLPSPLISTWSKSLLKRVLPTASSLLLSSRIPLPVASDNNPPPDRIGMSAILPRPLACIYMATAMALHFGGYEFARSSALALFTSSETGFSSPAAYPFAICFVTPVSLALLYWYGVRLEEAGPRVALRDTKILSASVLALSSWTLALLPKGFPILSRMIVAVLFIFQNSYAHLLYTQHWSFLGSVMTPSEGVKWFSVIGGLSSVLCTFAATIVHNLAHHVGLHGLIAGTCLTLSFSAVFADKAYALAEQVRTKT